MQLMILNPQMKAVGILDNRLPHALPYKDDVHHEKLEFGFRTLELKVPANHPTSALLETEGYLIYPNDDGKLELFQMKEMKEVHDNGELVKEIFCENSAVGNLTSVIVRPIRLTSASIESALSHVLATTGWNIGEVEYIGFQDFEWKDYPTSLSAVHDIVKSFEAEIDFEVKMVGSKITERLIHARRKRGRDTKKLFRYKQDVTGVTKTTDSKQIVTALIGAGKADSDGKILTFSSYNPTVEAGFEKVNDWVGNMEALQLYGIRGRHRFGVYKDDQVTADSELYRKTLAELKKLSKPLVNYSVDVAVLEKVTGLEGHKVRIGDTIRVQDEQLGVVVEARVIERKTTRSEKGKDSIVLGEFIPILSSPLQSFKKMESLIQQKEAVWTNGIVSANRVKGGTFLVGGESGTMIETKEVSGDEEVPVGFINHKEANLEKVTASIVNSPSVVSRNDAIYTISVDPKNGSDGNAGDALFPLATLGEAFRRIPKYNDGNITILIQGNPGTWREEDPAILGGIAGNGTITIDFVARTNLLESRMFLSNCTQPIYVWNGTIKNHVMFASDRYEGTVNFHNMAWIHMKNFYVDAVTSSNLMYAISETGSSYLRIEDCEGYNGKHAQIRVQEGSTLTLYKTATTTGGCKGSGGMYGLYAAYGAVIGGEGDCPTGSTSNLFTTAGAIANTTPTFNSGTKPTQTGARTTTTEWMATSVNSYRSNYGWRNDSTLRQGEYSNYGNHTGLAFFNYSDIKTKLTGKTIKSVQLYLERQAGGNNSEQPINLYKHSHTSVPSSAPTISLVKWNAGTYATGTSGKKYITIPNSVGEDLRDGKATGIAIYASSGSPYMVFNSIVKLKITYEG